VATRVADIAGFIVTLSKSQSGSASPACCAEASLFTASQLDPRLFSESLLCEKVWISKSHISFRLVDVAMISSTAMAKNV
jgi:hypothetical protein